jgi:hypothetical protein
VFSECLTASVDDVFPISMLFSCYVLDDDSIIRGETPVLPTNK